MKKNILFIVLLVSLRSLSQTPDSGSFFLHKFAQNIGKETYRISRTDNRLTYDIDFQFTDRGSPVPLKAQLVTTAAHEPISLFLKGNTCRFCTVNDTIKIKDQFVLVKSSDTAYGKYREPLSFPVDGYAPGTVQMVLLQYWKRHGEPKKIPILPKGEVIIKRDGTDKVLFNGKPIELERYVVSGLIWGNEIIWTDKNGGLICLITNDSEGDKLEMMHTAYEPVLPELINKAATYGMKLFAASMKMDVAKNKMLAIVGANVIDVENNKTLKNTTVIIENGMITQMGQDIAIPAKAYVIHAEGKTILPGLWDMHAHFQQAEWGPAYLAAGVTTVRDCGNEFGYINSIKDAIDSHKGVGPFIIKAGIIDGPGPMGLGIVRASTREEAIKAVRMYKDNGFAQIKLYSSITPAIVKVIADEAHRLGLTVTGHVPQNMSTQAGIDSGMNQINHMQYIYSMMKKNKDKSVDLNDSVSIAALDFLVAHKTVVDPTVGVYEMIFRSLSENILEMEPNFYKLPLPLQALFSSMGMPAAKALATKPRLQSMYNLVKVVHDKGIPMVAGTDMGFPGYSLARELELYVQAGLTPIDAIRSATIVPAQVMDMDNKLGSVSISKQADLVILDGDPLVDIRNTRKVWMVIKEGRQYDPEALHKMVGFQ